MAALDQIQMMQNDYKPRTRWIDTKGRLWMIRMHIDKILIEDGQFKGTELTALILTDLNTENDQRIDLLEFKRLVEQNSFKRLENQLTIKFQRS